MCIVNVTGTDVNVIFYKFGRILVVILNVTLLSIICLILTEFYGVVFFRDGGYTEWSKLSTCPVTCGGGLAYRRRTCTNPEPTIGGHNCSRHGPSLEVIQCNETPCPINGGFEQWSLFDACSVSCGGNGVQTRVRYCNNPVPKFEGKNCKELGLGEYEEKKACGEELCPINGGYSQWKEWQTCSRSCGRGEQLRVRVCDSPVPSNGGVDCTATGESSETRECDLPCPINGGYGEWTHWDQCTKTCGGGWHTRTRACDSPPQSSGGKTCAEQGFGNPDDTKPCHEEACNQNGGYGGWGEWSTCTKTCGGGRTERMRKCNNPKKSGRGKSCKEMGLGSSIEADECNTMEC